MWSRILRWGTPVLTALGLAVVGLLGLVLVRSGTLPVSPWGYLSFSSAVLGAVSGLALGVIRARATTEQ